LVALTFDDLRRDKRVKGFPFQVAEYLHRFTKRCYDESFTATKTISSYFGVDDRTVQRAMKCLSLAGYLVIIRDHTLNSRHRLRMLWRSAAATVFPSMRAEVSESLSAPYASENGNVAAASATSMSPSEAVPPDPPIKVSEDRFMGERTDCPGAGDPAFGPPAPVEAGSSSPPTPELLSSEEGEPEPEEVAELVREAASVLGAGPAAEGRVRAWCKRWCPGWVRAALGVTSARGDRVNDPAAYTFGTLRRFETEGGPLERSAPIAPTQAEIDAAWAFILGGPSPGAGP
jgi:hypothetical protein